MLPSCVGCTCNLLCLCCGVFSVLLCRRHHKIIFPIIFFLINFTLPTKYPLNQYHNNNNNKSLRGTTQSPLLRHSFGITRNRRMRSPYMICCLLHILDFNKGRGHIDINSERFSNNFHGSPCFLGSPSSCYFATVSFKW